LAFNFKGNKHSYIYLRSDHHFNILLTQDLQIKHDHQKKKNLTLKRGDNLKIQKVSNSEKIQKVGVNVEKDCKQKMFCF
jgi:hypothetical protein